MQASRGRRRGEVFSMRLTPETRNHLQRLQASQGGPAALGPWLVWRALEKEEQPRYYPSGTPGRVVPAQVKDRVILDLCAGSGSWSEPYLQAGYRVIRVTLPETDVRTYVPPVDVWGVLAAPPCGEFSIAKRSPRDFVSGMEIVNACMRIVLQA